MKKERVRGTEEGRCGGGGKREREGVEKDRRGKRRGNRVEGGRVREREKTKKRGKERGPMG